MIFLTTPTIVPTVVMVTFICFLSCVASFVVLSHPVSPPTFAAGMSKNDMSEAVLASSIDAVSHSELLSYADYLYLCDVSDVVVFVYTLQRDQ